MGEKQEVFLFAGVCIREISVYLGMGEERGEGRWVGNEILMIYICMLFGVLKHVNIFTI